MAISVNGRIVTDQAIEYELHRLIKFYCEHMPEAEVRKQLELLREKARDQAIGAALLIEEARKLDIKVPGEEVADRFEEMVRNAGGRDAFDRLLAQQNLSEELVRAGIEQGRRVDMLVDKISEGIPDPTEADMKAHYAAHTDEYMIPEQAQAQHILLRVEGAAEEDRAVARSRLLSIRRKVEEGADFGDMAAAHSDCPSGRLSGGSLGWISRGTMVESFDNAVFSMGVGDLSEVVETPAGFHLVRKTGEESSRPAVYEEVRDKIRDFLRHVARGEALASHVAGLRAKAVIEEH